MKQNTIRIAAVIMVSSIIAVVGVGIQTARASMVEISDIEASVTLDTDYYNTTSTNVITIKWTTDQTTSGEFQYGTVSGQYASSITTDPETRHDVTLNDLAPETKYYYRIIAMDEDGNTDISSQQTFTTLSTSLTVTAKVRTIGSTVIAFHLMSNKHPWSYHLFYGTSPETMTEHVLKNVEGVGTDIHIVKNLKPNTKYYYQARAEMRPPQRPEEAATPIKSFTTRGTTRITGISPTSGPKGTRITITGVNFGVSEEFDYYDGMVGDVETLVSVGCRKSDWLTARSYCKSKILSWSNTQIVISLGKHPSTGPVRIEKRFRSGFGTSGIFAVKGPTFTVR